MSIEEIKEDLIDSIRKTNDETLLEAVSKFFTSYAGNKTNPLSESEFLSNIEESVADYHAGRYKSASDLLNSMEE